MKIKLLSLFSGIGAFEKALKNIGIDYELVGFSEIDKYAIKSYCAIHNIEENKNLGDISKIAIEELPKDIDLITHGSPCQDFSIAGKQAGGDKESNTRSSLMWKTVDIIEQTKPKYVIWENVKNLLSEKHIHNFNNYIKIMYELGYNSYYQVLNAKDYGIPQNRERVYTISIRKDLNQGFEFPKKQELKLRLKDILENNVDKKYYLSNNQVNNYINNNNGNYNLSGKGINGNVYSSNIISTITTNKGEGVKINIAGNLDIKGQDSIKRVYSSKGISPTLTNMQGGNRQPKILCLNTKNKIQSYQQDRVYDINGIMTTISAELNGRFNIQEDLKIRRLTPKECWRLMGFSDEDFKKAEKINSNTQLYKQARKFNSSKCIKRNI